MYLIIYDVLNTDFSIITLTNIHQRQNICFQIINVHLLSLSTWNWICTAQSRGITVTYRRVD